jgi:ABC-type transport system involved in cytochrome bd biosynthesis fused ATPase/permease subunit
MKGEKVINPSLDVAIRVRNATFHWASTDPPSSDTITGSAKLEKGQKAEIKTTEKVLSDAAPKAFAIENLNLEIRRGMLVALVGPVGSGKSSLLQGVSYP